VQKRIADLRLQIDIDARVLFVESVNSSGRTATFVRMCAGEDATIVGICDTNPGAPTHYPLCKLDITRWEPGADGKCEECERTKPLFIDPFNYDPLPLQKPEKLRLTAEVARRNRSFWEIADRCDCIELHVSKVYRQDNLSRQRHFGVFVDTVKLARSPEFQELCRQAIRSFPVPDLGVIIDHEFADASDVIARMFTPQGTPLLRVVPGKLSPDAIARCCAARCIWGRLEARQDFQSL
jgi:hypothetical protein